MIFEILYSAATNEMWHKTGKTIEEVETALVNTEIPLPIACIYDFESKTFLKFDQRYLRHKPKFLQVAESMRPTAPPPASRSDNQPD